MAGKLPCSQVYETDRTFAFMDITPVNKGHVLIVPKSHHQYLVDVESETASEMMAVAQQVNKSLRKLASEKKIQLDAVNLFMADGKEAGQVVPHCHLHVLPRFSGDQFVVEFESTVGKPSKEDLDQLAGIIQENIE